MDVKAQDELTTVKTLLLFMSGTLKASLKEGYRSILRKL